MADNPGIDIAFPQPPIAAKSKGGYFVRVRPVVNRARMTVEVRGEVQEFQNLIDLGGCMRVISIHLESSAFSFAAFDMNAPRYASGNSVPLFPKIRGRQGLQLIPRAPRRRATRSRTVPAYTRRQQMRSGSSSSTRRTARIFCSRDVLFLPGEPKLQLVFYRCTKFHPKGILGCILRA